MLWHWFCPDKKISLILFFMVVYKEAKIISLWSLSTVCPLFVCLSFLSFLCVCLLLFVCCLFLSICLSSSFFLSLVLVTNDKLWQKMLIIYPTNEKKIHQYLLNLMLYFMGRIFEQIYKCYSHLGLGGSKWISAR